MQELGDLKMQRPKSNYVKIIGKSFLAVLKSLPKLFRLFLSLIPSVLLNYFNIPFQSLPTPLKLLITLAFFLFALLISVIWDMAKTVYKLQQNNIDTNRRYKRLESIWRIRLDDNETYYIEVTGIRRLLCVNEPIHYINVIFDLAENKTPFSKDFAYNFSVTHHRTTNYSGIVSASPTPYKATASNLSFRIEFNPPLQQNDEVEFTYTHALPHYKPATLEKLRELKSKDDVNDYSTVYRAFTINDPTDDYMHTLIFEPECKVRPKGFIKFVDGTEIDISSSEGCGYSFDGHGRLTMVFHKINPTVRSKYRILWTPPRRAELSDSHVFSTSMN